METRQLAILNKKEKTLLGSLSLTQAIRHAFQIAGFLLMPGLFILALGSFKGLWQAVLGGQFTWTAMYYTSDSLEEKYTEIWNTVKASA